MTKFYCIALFTVIGFFLTPEQSYACGTKSNKIETSSTKQPDSGIEKKDCCDKEKGQCGKNGKDCDGKCGNPACHCPTNCINFTIPFFAQYSPIKVMLSKPIFYYQETCYSPGLLSIWLPPKIS